MTRIFYRWPGSAHALVVSLMWLGCGPTTTSYSPVSVAEARRSETLEVPPTYVTPEDSGMIATRLAEANTWLLGGKYERAAHAFDQIVAFEPEGKFVATARYNAAFAYEQLGRSDDALKRYRAVIERNADSSEARSALIRASRLLAYAEDWETLVLYSEQLIARPDLSDVDRIEALGSHGLGLVEQGQVNKAALSVAKARTLIEDHGFHEAGKLTVGMAQVYFALGEVRRMRGEKIVFDPVPRDFAEVLEERCQSLLDAQDAYATAMRAYDAHWSAMAGYRVGAMYHQLHRDLMKVPAPKSATTQSKRELFEGAMQLRYRVLLEKGLRMLDRTLAMAQRTGESSAWVNRARDAKTDLERSMEAVQETLDKLPYAEKDLQRALDSLKATP